MCNWLVNSSFEGMNSNLILLFNGGEMCNLLVNSCFEGMNCYLLLLFNGGENVKDKMKGPAIFFFIEDMCNSL